MDFYDTELIIFFSPYVLTWLFFPQKCIHPVLLLHAFQTSEPDQLHQNHFYVVKLCVIPTTESIY